jgi:ATP-dependent RNA helicase DDX56/DBP9
MADSTDLNSSNAYLEVKNTEDKYIIVYTLLKLSLITGKVIIYTNTKETGYKLKLFLEEFHIKTVLLNYELPKATRHLAITNFVSSCDVLIAIDPDEKESQNKDTKRHKIYKSPVSVLINFDMPTSYKVFTKRLSDASTQYNAGMSILNLIDTQELNLLTRIKKKLEKLGKDSIEKLSLRMDQFEKFRYRCEDVLKGVTHKNIRVNQLNDVKKAILGVKEAKEQFEANPDDKKILLEAKKKHKPLRHLGTVPDYLLPDELKKNTPAHKVKYQEFEKKLAKRQKREPKEVEPETLVEETPETIAWQDLAPTSNRKLWKIKHHFSISKRPSKKPRRL